MSPVTIALAVTGWFLTQASIRSLAIQGDISVPTPDAQYWARSLFFRTLGLMASGLAIALTLVVLKVNFHLAWQTQCLLTTFLIVVMIIVTKLSLPGFFMASWELHQARERRKHSPSSVLLSRVMIHAVASLILVASVVGSFAFVQALRIFSPI